LVTREQINALAPGANPEMVNAIVENWEVAENAGINTPKRIRQFFANIAAETNLKNLTEDMSYSAKAILKTWPKRFKTEQEAGFYARKPELLAEKVYGGRMGNREGAGDGYRYRGRGFLQTTGREGYAKLNEKIGEKYGVDFLKEPEKLAEPKFAFLAAVYEWETRGCNELADKGDATAVRKAINGADNGLVEVKSFLVKAEKIWPDRAMPSLSGEKNTDQRRKENPAALPQIGPVPTEKSVRLNVPVPAQKPSSQQQGAIPLVGSATEASLTADPRQQRKMTADAFMKNPKQALALYAHNPDVRDANDTLDSVIRRGGGRRHPMVSQMHRYLAKRIEHGKAIPTPQQAFKMISNALDRGGRGD